MRNNEVERCNKKIREKLNSLEFDEKTKIYTSNEVCHKYNKLMYYDYGREINK